MKHMRLPNGFGSITKVTGKRLRNPYYVRVTVGKTETGRPILKSLKPAYYKTYNEAYYALLKYHQNPYDLSKDITMNELFERWLKEYTLEKNIPQKKVNDFISVWKYGKPLWNLKVKQVRVPDLKPVILNASEKRGEDVVYASATYKQRLKSICNMMLDYAVECEIVNINYARSFTLPKRIKEEEQSKTKHHIIFSRNEMEALWAHQGNLFTDMILVDCYMGWRPGELIALKNANISWKDFTITGGSKTEAGKNRVVPIIPQIRNIIRRYYDPEQVYLFHAEDYRKMSYEQFHYGFNSVIDKLHLNPDHAPHDGRKTFITMCKNAGVNDYAIKKIVGHSITDITESVYTDRPTNFLFTEMSKVSK